MSVQLPLLDRVDLLHFTNLAPPQLIPARKPHAGEQYRFHFDMEKCIGCKCCVVACNEQNGNPATVNWRRVGEIEAGTFPIVQRFHLSMGCNHCIEPTCMKGCPVKAYTKDALTGIVDHNADLCIGCQYCTWNCSYGVPQFNEARGVVGKCDMCHTRLNQDMAPACVNACPESAIAIEIVRIADWRADHALAEAPGMPSADDSLSSTRVTLPSRALKLERVDTARVLPQHPHASLIVLLVLTQMSVGILAMLLCASPAALPYWSYALPFVVVALALAAAPAHLGRPIYAHRAWAGWRTSWLSREVIAFGLYANAALVYAVAGYSQHPLLNVVGVAGLVAGIGGVISSAAIYMVPARPAWNTFFTVLDFVLTGALLGSATAAVLTHQLGFSAVAVGIRLVQAIVRWHRDKTFRASHVFELHASAGLLRGALQPHFQTLIAFSILTILLLPWIPAAGLAFAILTEAASRWIFFAAVVPKNIASTFLTPGGKSK